MILTVDNVKAHLDRLVEDLILNEVKFVRVIPALSSRDLRFSE